jgi:hypothetical protein
VPIAAVEGNGVKSVVEYIDDDVVDRPLVQAQRETYLSEPLQPILWLGRYDCDDR